MNDIYIGSLISEPHFKHHGIKHKNDSKVALTAIRYDNLDFADNVNEVIGQSSKKPRYQTFDQSVEKGSSFVLQYKRS